MTTTKHTFACTILLIGTTSLAACSSTSDTEPTTEMTTTSEAASEQYQSCAEARDAGDTPLSSDNPRYNESLDRDGDGTACESSTDDKREEATSEAQNVDSSKSDEQTTESDTSNWGTALQEETLAVYGIDAWNQITDKYPGDPKGHILDMHSEGDSLLVVTNLDQKAGKEIGEQIATQMSNQLTIGKENNDLPDGAEKADTVNVMTLTGDLIAHKSVS
ncbi:excalibur calcium-binding domain-containing protein [Corynebacterium lowii]|uniref:Excalibur calcium-binding domain protein n=1 Tax=Corynebacterium lowii TaxID=1544413 RepID=A0A0Q0UKJ2_9CORY|nr:excalibur calcium-binding domain-containing protein [Corynebacterium lowii]KQB86806.1 Excalibur calcium-binding domain protein [Corynebacterium lowii]MDP9851492.1 hypothetical protein [Corynebacterium lowii]